MVILQITTKFGIYMLMVKDANIFVAQLYSKSFERQNNMHSNLVFQNEEGQFLQSIRISDIDLIGLPVADHGLYVYLTHRFV